VEKLTYEDLRAAVAGTSVGLRSVARLAPLGGPGDKLFPPTFGDPVAVVVPHALDRRDSTREEGNHQAVLDEALQGMCELRAGSAGRLVHRRTWIDVNGDLLTAPSQAWGSVTTCVVTRHARVRDASAALATDLIAECRRRGLSAPSAAITLHTKGVAGTGLSGRARLEFSAAVRGPVLLGRNRRGRAIRCHTCERRRTTACRGRRCAPPLMLRLGDFEAEPVTNRRIHEFV
jgi:hypothetical protein